MESQKSKHGHINLLHMEGGTTCKELLNDLAAFAVSEQLARPELIGALLEREDLYPTGIEAVIGVAIPHADPIYTCEASMVIATLQKPVMFRPMGGASGEVAVEIVFMLLVKDSSKHLDLLGTIVKFIQNKVMVESLKGSHAISVISDSFDQFFESAS